MRAMEFLNEIGLFLKVFVNNIWFRHDEEGLFAKAPLGNQDILSLKIQLRQKKLPKVLYYYFQLKQNPTDGQLSHSPLLLQDGELNINMAINSGLGLVKWPENEVCIMFLWPKGIFYIISISIVFQFKCAFLRAQLLYEGEAVRDNAGKLLLRHPENASFHCWSSLLPIMENFLKSKKLHLADDGQAAFHQEMLVKPLYKMNYSDLTPGKATVVWYTESLNAGFAIMDAPAADGKDRYVKISSKAIKGVGFHALTAGEKIFVTLEQVRRNAGPHAGEVQVQAKLVEKSGLSQAFSTGNGLRYRPFAELLASTEEQLA